MVSAIDYLIPHLETVLLLVAAAYPVGFCANVTVLVRGGRGFMQSRSLAGDLVGFISGYLAMVAVVVTVRSHDIADIRLPRTEALAALAPIVGVACIGLEYAVGVVLLLARTGKLVTALSVHRSYSRYRELTLLDVTCVVALVVGEELILRQVLFTALAVDLSVAAGPAIVICAVAYAVNHLQFGVMSAVAKIPSGVLYTALFYLSGSSIAVVIVAHATQNLVLLALSRKR